MAFANDFKNQSSTAELSVEETYLSVHHASYALLGLLAWSIFRYTRPRKTDAPLGNPAGSFIGRIFKIIQRVSFFNQGSSLMRKASEKYPKQCFEMITDLGDVVIVPNEFANVIRNDERADYVTFYNEMFPVNVNGLGPLQADHTLIEQTLVIHMTRLLGRLTRPLHEEAQFAVQKIFTDSADWHPVLVAEAVEQLVTRVTARVLVGVELCRNEKWLDAARRYSMAGFMAGATMKLCPGPLKVFVSYLNPACHRAEKLVKQGRECLVPVLEQRRREKKSGSHVPNNDCLDWFEDRSKTAYDPVIPQLALSTASVWTSSFLLSTVLGDLAENPDIIEPLRAEMVKSFTAHGCTKAAIQDLKLLDSCLRESARLKPQSLVAMRRKVVKDMKLPDGTLLKKGATLCVASDNTWDPKFHENPDQWDGGRFYRQRHQEGQENTSQLVSVGQHNLTFGYGKPTCPGRFFASDALKMILVHFLLKYDIKLRDGKQTIKYHGVFGQNDGRFTLDIKRRKAELDLDSL